MRRYPRKYTPKEKITLIKVPSTAVSNFTHIATHSDHGSHTRDFGGWVPYFYTFTRQSFYISALNMPSSVSFHFYALILGRIKMYANLRNMRQFYQTYKDSEKCQTLSSKLTWSHNRLIMRVRNSKVREQIPPLSAYRRGIAP